MIICAAYGVDSFLNSKDKIFAGINRVIAPGKQKAILVPEAPETLEIPEDSEVSEDSENPETPEIFEAPEVLKIPGVLEVSEAKLDNEDS